MDHIEYGQFQRSIKYVSLGKANERGRPTLVTSVPPVLAKDGAGQKVPDAVFIVSVLNTVEKGSDVNVAAHLLKDLFTRAVDAAVVVSNDSDLALPLREARRVARIGLVNPTRGRLAGKLAGRPTDGVGGHWWDTLAPGDFTSSQLPDRIGRVRKPEGW